MDALVVNCVSTNRVVWLVVRISAKNNTTVCTDWITMGHDAKSRDAHVVAIVPSARQTIPSV